MSAQTLVRGALWGRGIALSVAHTVAWGNPGTSASHSMDGSRHPTSTPGLDAIHTRYITDMYPGRSRMTCHQGSGGWDLGKQGAAAFHAMQRHSGDERTGERGMQRCAGCVCGEHSPRTGPSARWTTHHGRAEMARLRVAAACRGRDRCPHHQSRSQSLPPFPAGLCTSEGPVPVPWALASKAGEMGT